MAKHNAREKGLLTDLNEKNRLAGELRRLSMRLGRWRERVRRGAGRRWTAQYGRSIRRAEARIDAIRDELLQRAEDVKNRIQQEQKISKTEVQQFEKQLAKEVGELKKARQELAATKQVLAEAEGKSGESREAAELLETLQRRRGRADRKLRREARDVKRVRDEIDSEEQDAQVFLHELQRAVAEIESLRR